ncbi:pyrimidine 5'-nucleotidase [Pseudoalteromonas denitrificans]|uniref:Putative hydrolase of the HAD superfamily n=1 Tax=Pseudoalteromonas denitrificans DSM 6059 TaxID=1123010 RepID=A0A1I1PQY5_9GAMM|nr:pyrimidine 5'-nucleotidase [Pseudoalteromonas denitrificans]SFD12334.1 putative hydrolase of the HAD superfamily [Pseudoalteromonas denitrificans DSM 6059]
MKYKWILFDADETLFHFDSYQGLKLMFSRFDVDFTPCDFEHYQSVNQPLWVDYQNGDISAKQLQNKRFESWSEKLKVSTQKLNSEFLHAMAEICKPLAGAKELIDFLSDKVSMGIITNGFTQLQTIRLERTGFKDAFSTLVISEQVGVAKPDIGIFEHAFETMKHPPKHEILMVGDNPHSDIQGGMNAGIDTCWLNTNNHTKPDGIEPTHEVSSLTQLKTLLASISTR